MTDDRPPFWIDLLLTGWVLVVGVIYFGGYFVPSIGALTGSASAVYALMVLISVIWIAVRYLNRSQPSKDDDRTKK